MQVQVLARAREKLSALEARVAELEAQAHFVPAGLTRALRLGTRFPIEEAPSMNVAAVFSRGLAGLDAPLVRVEAHMGRRPTQLPASSACPRPR